MTGRPTPACLVCGADTTQDLLSTDLVTLCNRLYTDLHEALTAPTAPFVLSYCASCGHGFNSVFDPARAAYDTHYDNPLHFSPTYRDYAETQAHKLIDRYKLRGRRLVEIGCGQGEWLQRLSELGENCGIGFDPAFRGEQPVSGHVEIRNGFAPKGKLDQPADMVIARHVLEHLDDPSAWLAQAVEWLDRQDAGLIYIEVPNADYMWRSHAIWDLIYEHVSYFSRTSLTYALTRAGFEMIDLEETYGGQFLVAIARPTPNGAINSQPIAAPEHFAGAYQSSMDKWSAWFDEVGSKNETAVIWGAGSKGVSFAHLLARSQSPLRYAIDINRNKDGKLFPATALPIYVPQQLSIDTPDHILIMNPIYAEEIEAQAREILTGSGAPIPRFHQVL